MKLGNSLTLSYTYHISGAVKTAEVRSADNRELYADTLYYEDCGNNACTPQYNGNISRMAHRLAHGNGNYGEFRNVQYTYDELNRLTKVDDLRQDVFDEIFAYDAQGRIAMQRRGANTNSWVTSGGEYTYKNGTNKLISVANEMGGTADERNMSDTANFVYDSVGNLTYDKYLQGEGSKNALVHFYCRTVVYCALRNSKEMEISYDWRGMPIEFIQQSQPAGSSSDTLFRLLMKYDGTGRRISKTVMHKVAGAADWDTAQVTHYTGIGTEIRENYAGPAKQTKVVVNMPVFFRVTLTRLKPRSYIEKDILRLSNGGAIFPKQSFGASRQSLGRYGIEDAENPDMGSGVGYIPNTKFEWYLKNHLGSTMLVYGTVASTNPSEADVGETMAAYDYRAFGEMIELMPPPTGKVTENFTGKEHDDEIALNYFGARYLDPMLGMWISVDPKRQHFSPYTYGSNNPIARIDPNGNADLRMAVFYNRDQNGKVLPPNLKQDVDRTLSGALNPWYDTYKVKYFGENASAEEISNFINGGDFGAIAMHGEIDANGVFNAHDMDGNYIDAYDLKFNVKTLLGACHSEAFIRFEDETGNLVAPKYDEKGMTKSFVESINFLINNSDTKNPYRVDFMGGEKD